MPKSEDLDTRQASTSKLSENVSVVNYDQWYNQSIHPQLENSVLSLSSKQRLAEQHNIENVENIQQPIEFVNLEVVSPEAQKRDIYGSRDSINKETLDNDQQLLRLKEPLNRESKQEVNNTEVSVIQQPLLTEQEVYTVRKSSNFNSLNSSQNYRKFYK